MRPFYPVSLCPTTQPKDYWIKELSDGKCKEKEVLVQMDCEFSKPHAIIRWYKNKIEIFTGQKYTFTNDKGVIKLSIHRIGMEDNATYSCQANDKKTTAVLHVEGLNPRPSAFTNKFISGSKPIYMQAYIIYM